MNNFWDNLSEHILILVLPLIIMTVGAGVFSFALWEYITLGWGFLRTGVILGVLLEFLFLVYLLGGKSKDE
tara:strand:+ start:338 stop:550 length:213 start_codon:yes stop_codon:yes gene_type:complete